MGHQTKSPVERIHDAELMARRALEQAGNEGTENRRLRALLAECRDWFDAPGGDPDSSELLRRINDVLGGIEP